jgi:hypothetical protein
VELSDFQQEICDGLTPERLMAMLSGFFGLLAASSPWSDSTASSHSSWPGAATAAERGQVIARVMREAALLLAIGIVIGCALSPQVICLRDE